MRTLVALLLWVFAGAAHASMTMIMVALEPSEAALVASDTQKLLGFLSASTWPVVHLDQTWHGIHFLLTGKSGEATGVRGDIVFGGQQIGRDLGYGPPRLLSPRQVESIAQELQALSPESMKANFDPDAMNAQGVYPTGAWKRSDPRVRDWLLDSYEKLRLFYLRAAQSKLAVLIVAT